MFESNNVVLPDVSLRKIQERRFADLRACNLKSMIIRWRSVSRQRGVLPPSREPSPTTRPRALATTLLPPL